MLPETLHVIALNVPWPANYGGVIDIYYKLRALHALGVKVILHAWQYDVPPATELEAVCAEVNYYHRQTGLWSNLSLQPYNVRSRSSEELVSRLLRDDHPILYEGLHTTFCLSDPRLAGRRQVVRVHNIEHEYYRAIARGDRAFVGKAFHYIESLRFAHYEGTLRYASALAPVSTADARALTHCYPELRVMTVPCFHAYESVRIRSGSSDYLLYHAKLSVPENARAAEYLVSEVMSHLPYRCVIAGMNPPASLRQQVAQYDHIELRANPSLDEMEELIAEAQIHLLYTDQPTGLKLKLLGSLFAGRHVVANPDMLTGSGLDALCHIASTAEAMRQLCHSLMEEPMTEDEIQRRAEGLRPYEPRHLALELMRLFS